MFRKARTKKSEPLVSNSTHSPGRTPRIRRTSQGRTIRPLLLIRIRFFTACLPDTRAHHPRLARALSDSRLDPSHGQTYENIKATISRDHGPRGSSTSLPRGLTEKIFLRACLARKDITAAQLKRRGADSPGAIAPAEARLNGWLIPFGRSIAVDGNCRRTIEQNVSDLRNRTRNNGGLVSSLFEWDGIAE